MELVISFKTLKRDPETKKGPLRGVRRGPEEGGSLLSHLIGSTIGAGGLNFPVRDGKGWAPPPWPPRSWALRRAKGATGTLIL